MFLLSPLFPGLAFLVSVCLAFNFETRVPLTKVGAEGSYFGFSVAEHQSVGEVSRKVEHSWLLVGAPLDQNKQPKTNHSGALWSCPISSLKDDCVQVITDGKRTVDADVLSPPYVDEIKDGQWLGVTVRSQGSGGKVIVCAHRYMRAGADYRWGSGFCHTLSQRLDYDDTWEPCKGRSTRRGHEEYGFCQAGTSGLIVNDTALIGSPGPFTWKGTVYVFSVSDDFLERDKTTYYAPLEPSPVPKNSYLGMSVTAADFFGTGELAYAAGAPRANGTGQVVLFTNKRTVNIMSVRMTINGEQYASNFGYEMVTADVNGDGLPDLIVGAPNYFERNKGGAVYVYLNHNPSDGCYLECSSPLKLTGSPESRFGISIASLGDINKDKTDDIVVGAPYENQGVIYVYLGSKKGVDPTPSQVIKGEQYGVETFGYSLSGGLDVDGNGYPDLLTGAFESSAVLLFRARPIIHLKSYVKDATLLKNINPNVKNCPLNNDNYTCFAFIACVDITEGEQNAKFSYATLNYVLEGDVKSRAPRVYVDTHSRSIVNGTLRYTGTDTCHSHTVYIKNNAENIPVGISMRVNYTLAQEEPRQFEGAPLVSLNQFPILNQSETSKTFIASFLKDCGPDDICESLLQISASLNLPTNISAQFNGYIWELKPNMEIQLDVSVENLNESAYEAVLLIEYTPNIEFKKQVQSSELCTVEPNITRIQCHLGNPLQKSQKKTFHLKFKFLDNSYDHTNTSFELHTKTSSYLLQDDRVELPIRVVKASHLVLSGNPVPLSLVYRGRPLGESAIKYKEEIGPKIRHTYVIENKGPWHSENVDVLFKWPEQIANDKPLGRWLFYMESPPLVSGIQGACEVPSEKINPLRYGDKTQESSTSSFGPSRRTKRHLPKIVTSYDGFVYLNCSFETAKCFEFKCRIPKLPAGQTAIIEVTSRLWNSSLVEDYPFVKGVKITSSGAILKKDGVMSPVKDLEKEVGTMAVPDPPTMSQDTYIPYWWYIVGIIAGIILLLGLIILLWKCGFFKRKRVDPTLSGNLEKKTLDNKDY